MSEPTSVRSPNKPDWIGIICDNLREGSYIPSTFGRTIEEAKQSDTMADPINFYKSNKSDYDPGADSTRADDAEALIEWYTTSVTVDRHRLDWRSRIHREGARD